MNAKRDENGSEPGRMYLTSSGDLVMTARMEKAEGDSRLLLLAEIEYERIPDSIPENLSTHQEYFQGLKSQEYPHNHLLTGAQAVANGKATFASGIKLRNLQRILEWARDLNATTYPNRPIFPGMKYLSLGSRLALEPKLDLALLKARANYYLNLKEKNYPYPLVFSAVDAVQEALDELGIKVDAKNFP